MLDIKLIRKEPEKYLAKIRDKEPTADLSELLELDERVRQIKTEVEQLKSLRNDRSKEVGELKRLGKESGALIEEVRKIGEQISTMDHELLRLETAFTDALSRLPNIPMDDVKVSQ